MVDEAYQDKTEWIKKSIRTTAKVRFSFPFPHRAYYVVNVNIYDRWASSVRIERLWSMRRVIGIWRRFLFVPRSKRGPFLGKHEQCIMYSVNDDLCNVNVLCDYMISLSPRVLQSCTPKALYYVPHYFCELQTRSTCVMTLTTSWLRELKATCIKHTQTCRNIISSILHAVERQIMGVVRTSYRL